MTTKKGNMRKRPILLNAAIAVTCSALLVGCVIKTQKEAREIELRTAIASLAWKAAHAGWSLEETTNVIVKVYYENR